MKMRQTRTRKTRMQRRGKPTDQVSNGQCLGLGKYIRAVEKFEPNLGLGNLVVTQL